jgi:hypothetical protein
MFILSAFLKQGKISSASRFCQFQLKKSQKFLKKAAFFFKN